MFRNLISSQTDRWGHGLRRGMAQVGKQKFYAVRRGREVGVTRTWAECQQRVVGYKGAQFKSFPTLELAEEFLNAETTGFTSEIRKHSSTAKPPGLRENTFQSPQSTDGRIVIYTDGSCLGNGKNDARAGYGAFYDVDDHRNISGRLPGEKQTNQRGELFAMMKVLENHLESEEVLEIRSDSAYSIKACKTWMPAYVKSKDSRKKYQNLDLMLKVHYLIQQRSTEVHLVHVPAHCNIPGNEAADVLAKAGARLDPVE